MLRRLLMISFLLGLASCATIEGAGEDLESAGEAIQDSSDNYNE
ncbi:MAG: entericidin A/B family lipoprotein [Pseudomonadota bacterium]